MLRLLKSDKKRAAAQKLDSKRRATAEKQPFSETKNPETLPPVGRNQSILVADDNPVVLKAFELKLKAQGFNVTTTDAGSMVASTAANANAELIILDINLVESGNVEWSGFTVMQWMARFSELAHIPVILISGSEAENYQEKAIAAGAVAFFRKPINFEELLFVVVQSIEKSAARQ
jgi:CheY-like chemotaxis protein